jgi:hypothetical protein
VSPIADVDDDGTRRERAIESLIEYGTASPEEVRGLFAAEFARLERGAKVRRYLNALTTTNVRAELRRTKRIARLATKFESPPRPNWSPGV